MRVVEGDVAAVPLADGSMDAVISQEALIHVPDLPAVMGQAFRVLRPGGRFAFTTWVAPRPLSPADAGLMWEGMAVQRLYTREGHDELLRAAGFAVEPADDLTADWGPILEQRLAMYRNLRQEAQRAGTPAGHDAFYLSYVRLVELVQAGGLGGGRFCAVKP